MACSCEANEELILAVRVKTVFFGGRLKKKKSAAGFSLGFNCYF